MGSKQKKLLTIHLSSSCALFRLGLFQPVCPEQYLHFDSKALSWDLGCFRSLEACGFRVNNAVPLSNGSRERLTKWYDISTYIILCTLVEFICTLLDDPQHQNQIYRDVTTTSTYCMYSVHTLHKVSQSAQLGCNLQPSYMLPSETDLVRQPCMHTLYPSATVIEPTRSSDSSCRVTRQSFLWKLVPDHKSLDAASEYPLLVKLIVNKISMIPVSFPRLTYDTRQL